jgi:hypothetical protein
LMQASSFLLMPWILFIAISSHIFYSISSNEHNKKANSIKISSCILERIR